ncbi:MAG: hypothetical protein R3B70_19860 [Polyangiaceae bacterium]
MRGRGDAQRLVKRGRIRVDARKAIAKLRDHLLVDLHLYAVEVARAAVLAGATRIDVSYDADDVVLAFDGRPLDVEELPGLFEHLTAEAEGPDARFARLLALGVNAALGTKPAWISLTVADGGAASRVTWTPALVASIERGDGALPEPEQVAVPSDMPGTGTRFQLRRKVGWEVVRRAAAKDPPREVVLLAAAGRLPRVPMFVNGEPMPPPARVRALARAPISLPGTRSAFVEIAATTSTAPYIDFCELGLGLARTGLAFGRHFPMSEYVGVAPPVRIVIDADTLPTNASRSAVREDAPLFASLAHVAAPAVADLIAGIAATLFGRGAVPDGVTVDRSDEGALHDALGAFLCAAEASLIARVALPEALRSILDMPLFRDGLGRPLSHGGVPRSDPLLVWTRDKPLPPEMERWAGAIVWRTGRVAERIFAARRVMDPNQLVAAVKAGAERYRKLLTAPKGPPAVPDDVWFGRARFAFDSGPAAGLSGEVAVAPHPSEHARNRGLRVFFEGRGYETLPIPENAAPLPVVVAIEWPGQILPRFGYVGVEPTRGLHAALAIAVRAAVLLCDRLAAERAAENRTFSPQEAAVLRAALATAVRMPSHAYSLEGFEMPPLAELTGLLHAPIWPVLAPPSGTAFTSLHALASHAGKTGAVCFVHPAATGRPADQRPVVRAAAADIENLRMCLHPKVQLVPYDLALLPDKPTRKSARARLADFVSSTAAAHGAPIFRFDAKGIACFVTLGAPVLAMWHGEAELPVRPRTDDLGGVTLALDDSSLIPTARWDGVLHTDDPTFAARAEQSFAEHLAAAALGDATARAAFFAALAPTANALLASPTAPVRFAFPADPRALPPVVRAYLIDRATRGRAVDAPPAFAELTARIERIPLLDWIGPDGEPAPACLADIGATHRAPDRVPCLLARPRFRPSRWQPVLCADPVVLEALARWSGGRTFDAASELPAREQQATSDREYSQFISRPTVDPTSPGPRADPTSPVVRLPALPRDDIYGIAAALPTPEEGLSHAVVEVLLEERVLFEYTMSTVRAPLVGRVAVTDRKALSTFERLTSRGELLAVERARSAVIALAVRLLERAAEPGASALFFADPRARALVLEALTILPGGDRVARALTGGDLLWPTVQGGSRRFDELRSDGELWFGADSHASWIAGEPATDLDQPILHLSRTPQGEALAAILTRMSLRTRDVTASLAALQAQRARRTDDIPRLAERPAHPALARELRTLHEDSPPGEIALFESGDPAAEIHTLTGETRRLPLDLSFSARAVARTPILTSSAEKALTDRLSRDAVRLLVSLIPELDALPLFVRAHLRAVLCRAFSKERDIPAQVAAAPLFPDVDGAFWSLDELRAAPDGHWSCTFDPPPYAKARQEGVTLRLDPAEHRHLHGKLRILNITEWMRRDLDAERRREAPPAADLRLSPLVRERAVHLLRVDDGPLTGELAVLHPRAADARGIHVHLTGRPLCQLADAPGWPIAAVVNDDTLHATRWFDDLVPADKATLRRRVRAVATEHLRRVLEADLPPDRAAGTFLDAAVPPSAEHGSTAPMTVTGALHLPAKWPTAPTIRFFVQGFGDPTDQPLLLATAPLRPVLPACGVLFVALDLPFTRADALRLADHVRTTLATLVERRLQDAPADPELLAYKWNLRLLGAAFATDPTARAADGTVLRPADLLAALEKGPLWLTDRRGSEGGAFPGEPPPFFLADEPTPLLRVLHARLPAAKLRHLGGLVRPAAPTTAQAVSQSAAAASASARVGAHEPPRPIPSLAPPPDPAAAPAPLPELDGTAPPESKRRPERSWLSAVLDRVASAVGSAPTPEPAPTGLGAAVEHTLRALRLRDDPVVIVAEARRGKLVRYDKHTRVLTLNVAHPALASVTADPSASSAASSAAFRRATFALTAAALSEVNIALLHVTDHDESQALLELLRQDAAEASPAARPRLTARP